MSRSSIFASRTMEVLNFLLRIFPRIVVKSFVLMIAGTMANQVNGIMFTFADDDLYFKQGSDEFLIFYIASTYFWQAVVTIFLYHYSRRLHDRITSPPINEVSNHLALQLETAASTIISLKKDKAKAEKRIAGLKIHLQEAKDWAEEMQKKSLAVTVVDKGKGKGKEEENEEEEECWDFLEVLGA